MKKNVKKSTSTKTSSLDPFLQPNNQKQFRILATFNKEIIHPKLVNRKLLELWNALMNFATEIEKDLCTIPGCDQKKRSDPQYHDLCQECYSVYYYCFGKDSDPIPEYKTAIEKQLQSRKKLREKKS